MSRIYQLIFSLLVLIVSIPVSAQNLVSSDLFGTYGIGHNFGSGSITLREDGKFERVATDCTAVYQSAGTYSQNANVITFTELTSSQTRIGETPHLASSQQNSENAADGKDLLKEKEKYQLRLVKWSNRHYLIEEKSMEDFVQAINLGLEPRTTISTRAYLGAFYLRKGDESKQVRGLPTLSQPLAKIILKRAISARILKVEKQDKRWLITIDKGSAQGVKTSTRFVAKYEEPSFVMAKEVIAVKKNSAQLLTWDKPKVGERLFTKYQPLNQY